MAGQELEGGGVAIIKPSFVALAPPLPICTLYLEVAELQFLPLPNKT